MFGGTWFTRPIITNDLGMLLNDMKPLAIIGYAENPDETDTPRKKTHMKYLKANTAKLMKEALDHLMLLQLILDNKLLKPETTELFLQAATEQQNTEAIAMLLDYQANKLTAKDKEKAIQKAEKQEEQITDYVFTMTNTDIIRGKKFAVVGKLMTFESSAVLSECLTSVEAALVDKLSPEIDYLVTNLNEYASEDTILARAWKKIIISEAELNELMGREFDPDAYQKKMSKLREKASKTQKLLADVSEDAQECIDVLWMVSKNGEVTKYRGTDPNVFFPLNIKGQKVTGIHTSFTTDAILENVILPEGYETIGTGVFRDQRKLQRIALPKSLEEIGNEAFFGCTSLIRLILPKGLSCCGHWAFRDCTGLERAVLQEKITHSSSLRGCKQSVFRFTYGKKNLITPNDAEKLFQDNLEEIMEIIKLSKTTSV